MLWGSKCGVLKLRGSAVKSACVGYIPLKPLTNPLIEVADGSITTLLDVMADGSTLHLVTVVTTEGGVWCVDLSACQYNVESYGANGYPLLITSAKSVTDFCSEELRPYLTGAMYTRSVSVSKMLLRDAKDANDESLKALLVKDGGSASGSMLRTVSDHHESEVVFIDHLVKFSVGLSVCE
jgi:hypothetical protein